MKKYVHTAALVLALTVAAATGCAAQVTRVRMQVGRYLCNF